MKNIITEEKSIASCDDFELGINRKTPLSYRISYPHSKKINGVVFVILGFGAEPSYIDTLRTFIAREFSVVAVDVSYHCFSSRPINGAKFEFDALDAQLLQDMIDHYQMDFSGLSEVTTESVMIKLNEEVSRLKEKGVFQKNYKLQQSITLVPPNNEYQNFGMMQAIDHINVLHDIEKLGLLSSTNVPVCLIGSSHGGYLAHLIAKLAPHKIDSVIENSCYVQPLLSYVVGKETNILRPEFIVFEEHVQFNCFVQTWWTTNSKSKNFYSPSHAKIRDVNDVGHLKNLAQRKHQKTKFISYHSAADGLVNIEDKKALYKTLNEFGFEATLHIVKDASQVDGSFIKSLSHAMGMSLKELVKRELTPILEQEKRVCPEVETDVTHLCNNLEYTFRYTQNNLEVIFKTSCAG